MRPGRKRKGHVRFRREAGRGRDHHPLWWAGETDPRPAQHMPSPIQAKCSGPSTVARIGHCSQ